MREAEQWCTSYTDYPPGTSLNLTHAQGTLLPYKVLKGDLGASIGASPSVFDRPLTGPLGVFYRPLIGSLGASLGVFYRPLTGSLGAFYRPLIGSPGAFYRPLIGSPGASPGASYRTSSAPLSAFYRPLTGSLGANSQQLPGDFKSPGLVHSKQQMKTGLARIFAAGFMELKIDDRCRSSLYPAGVRLRWKGDR